VPTPLDLMVSLLIGSIASGDVLYGRRQSSPVALISGLGLMLLPLLVPTGLPMVGLALALMALPLLLNRR